jgi:hypothetical protein
VGPVSTGASLVGFQEDGLCFLEQCELFASVEVKITDDPHCVLEGSCVVVDDAASDDTVASTLERIWLDYLRYGWRSSRRSRPAARPAISRPRRQAPSGSTRHDPDHTSINHHRRAFKLLVHGRQRR